VTQPASPLFLRPPGTTWAEALLAAPFALVQGARDRGRTNTRGHTGGLGTPSRYTRDLDPAEGVLTVGLTNRHAAVVEGWQRG
jgi:hypothetical protein